MLIPRKEELADGVTLHLGDCRDVLPTLGKADAVVTDPPYGIGQDGGRGHRLRSNARVQEKLGWDSDRPERALFEMLLAAGREHVLHRHTLRRSLRQPQNRRVGDFERDAVQRRRRRPHWQPHGTSAPASMNAWTH